MEEINKVNKIIENNNEEKLRILTNEELMVIVKKYSINYHSMNRSILEKESHIQKLESDIQTLKNNNQELESDIQTLKNNNQELESVIQTLKNNNQKLIKESKEEITNLKNKSDENIKAICLDRDSKTFKERFASITMVFLLCILLYKGKKEKY